ncbi:ubiquitin-like-conjugating enzyme ATG10 isoform X2 [Ricinus communis]|uniref:ubiquitin-like-conjugating enzyme ATG10 isoform X2 n=1 Tax=Ricinus communis TaxID=3988 RepID=UPI000D686C8B|nr:ubiquitin-like-conjugating enzyme ATG10 isoform X2 [Ricinus communis]|eukprot:XP_025014559.1 ubiquitin-like-conjugating enzyme ATG10 isoform X2 [Ricinus communis]
MEVDSYWDGTLSLKQFIAAAHTFAEKWKRINSASPPWSWINAPKRPYVASQQKDSCRWRRCVFLFLRIIMIIVIAPGKKRSISLGRKRQLTMMPLCSHHQVHYYDFHIVYSNSYRVPVLYFRGYCSDGRPLQLNEIEKDLPTCSAKVLLESKWTFITQEEHPYLNRPWHKLHPCGTSEWMRLLFLGDAVSAEKRVAIELYLVSWFSVAGQVISLRIPIEMRHLVQKFLFKNYHRTK